MKSADYPERLEFAREVRATLRKELTEGLDRLTEYLKTHPDIPDSMLAELYDLMHKAHRCARPAAGWKPG